MGICNCTGWMHQIYYIEFVVNLGFEHATGLVTGFFAQATKIYTGDFIVIFRVKSMLMTSLIFLIFGITGTVFADSTHCSHLLAAGDGIKISVYPETTHFLNGIYKISDSGQIDLPIVGCVNVMTKPLSEIESDLKNRYLEYINYPNIKLTPQIRIAVVGGFHTPGLYWVHPFDGVWDVIKSAGGTIRSDGIEKIKWIHNGTIVAQPITKAFQSGQSLTGMGFTSGDQIVLTPKVERTEMEVFLQDVLPILGFAVSTLSATASLYLTYSLYQQTR